MEFEKHAKTTNEIYRSTYELVYIATSLTNIKTQVWATTP